MQFIGEKPAVDLFSGKCLAYHSFLGEIEFKDVAFSYPTRPGQVITSHSGFMKMKKQTTTKNKPTFV
jgi:hypothetical protein